MEAAWQGSQPLLLWYVAALAVSVVLVRAFRSIAIRYGYVARPRQDRWHRRPTALLGGAAVALTSIGLGLASGSAMELLPLLAAGALMAIVGVADDVLSLKPATKLIAEIALASVLLIFGYRLHWSSSLTFDILLTAVWIVGVTNAFNLLDNMDGLCGGIALIAGASLLIGLAARGAFPAETRYLAVLLGATSGFLVYNVHPASIFLGDGGSLFLGFSIASLTLITGGPTHDRSHILSVVGAPVLVLLIPIFDTTLVTVSRLVSGRSVAQGGRDHSSHRLVAIGLSERAAVGVLWTLAAAAGVLGFAVRLLSNDWAGLLGATFVLSVAVFAVYLSQVRVYDEPPAGLGRGVTPMVVDFMYKRRVAEVLLDVCLISLTYYAAWRLRFPGDEWSFYSDRFRESLPIALTTQLVAMFIVGVYRGAWRYFGLMDGVAFVKGVAAGVLALIAGVAYLYRFDGYSRGVFVIYAALLLLALSASRASFRLIGEFARRRRSGTRLIVYGAGDAGTLVMHELLADPGEQYRMIGFIDDDPAKQRLRLHGYSVIGAQPVLMRLISDRAVDVVVISSRRFDDERLRLVESACKTNDIRLMRFHTRFESLVSCA